MIAGAHTLEDGQIDVTAPEPGLFRAHVALGDVVRPGRVLGVLEVLGRAVEVTAPDSAHGQVVALADPTAARPAVGYGAMLLRLDPSAQSDTTAPTAIAPAHSATGPVFRAPTSGRYYGRSSPDKPAFVEVGATLAPGATVCLLEVMKTFHRVTYTGAPAKVRELLVAEGADVNAGDPLLALES